MKLAWSQQDESLQRESLRLYMARELAWKDR
jgi:hypothetical protein